MRDGYLQSLETRRDELVALTQALIRFPTINPPGEAYTPCAHYIGQRLGRRGFDITYERGHDTPGDSDRYPRTNIIARREGRMPGPVVHFNGHIDVVAVGQGWTLDPFAGVVRDGRIYGRGACDMKGGLAAAIVAVETLIDTAPDLPGALEISGTVDEESGGFGGVAYLAGKGFFSAPRVDHVIIPEPLNVDRVCLGHRGVWWGEIETHGRIAHGSMPFFGDSAIGHMGAVLERIETELQPALAARRTSMPVVPPGARASSGNINSIHGGLGEDFDGLPAALVADRCRMVLDRRFLIEEKLDDVRDEISQLLEALKRDRPKFDYKVRELWAVESTMTDKNAAVVQAVAAEIDRVLGRPAEMVISPGTYDQKHVARIGHLHDCIAYGPGILDLAHQPDEYVVIDDMMAAAAVMGTAAYRLLTGEMMA
ncbi:MAG: acetylornithine deacetylase/succinyl-diaminopimelate desuccinylase family protein [Hyphomicrobiales bacterium]